MPTCMQRKSCKLQTKFVVVIFHTRPDKLINWHDLNGLLTWLYWFSMYVLVWTSLQWQGVARAWGVCPSSRGCGGRDRGVPEDHPPVPQEAFVGEWGVTGGASVCSQHRLLPVGKWFLFSESSTRRIEHLLYTLTCRYEMLWRIYILQIHRSRICI